MKRRPPTGIRFSDDELAFLRRATQVIQGLSGEPVAVSSFVRRAAIERARRIIGGEPPRTVWEQAPLFPAAAMQAAAAEAGEAPPVPPAEPATSAEEPAPATEPAAKPPRRRKRGEGGGHAS
jgi:hypothetical protein